MTEAAHERVRLPWLSAADAKMLSALPPEDMREMSNLLHQQAREQERFDQMVEPTPLVDVERRRGGGRTPAGRRLPVQAGDPLGGVMPRANPAYVNSLRALMSAAHDEVRAPDDAWAAAAQRVLSWYDDDPRRAQFVRALADQRVAGAEWFSVERAAREAGLPATSARRYLRELLEMVADEYLFPLEDILGVARHELQRAA